MNAFDNQLALPCVYRWQPYALIQEVQCFAGLEGLQRLRFERALRRLDIGLPGDWQDLVNGLRAKQMAVGGKIVCEPSEGAAVESWHPHDEHQARRGCCGQWVCCDCDC